MALKLFNTLGRKLQTFKPLKDNKVGLYTCGPTVYNYPHIGNYRAYSFSDLLKRYLLYKGYKVTHIMNLTDVDDKTIRDSQKEHLSLKEFTTKYEKAFYEDLKSLQISFPDKFTKATEHIKEMVQMTKKLLAQRLAYKAEDGSIYYKVSRFKDYGKLANINIKELKQGASKRIKSDEYTKEQVQDFALWKAYDTSDADVFWNTELGKGRPGWHIECSAMSTKYLGNQFDIHTGGVDLIFPHHQNEIAQSEGSTSKKPFVKYWLHNEWVMVDGKKMAKSAGNFYTLRDIINKGYQPLAYKLLALQTHYRSQFNFTFDSLSAAQTTLNNLNSFKNHLLYFIPLKNKDNKNIPKLVEQTKNKIEQALDKDLNSPIALSELFNFISKLNEIIQKQDFSQKNQQQTLEFMNKTDQIFGLLSQDQKPPSKQIIEKIKQREDLRKQKNFQESDKLRAQLQKDYILEDAHSGIFCIPKT